MPADRGVIVGHNPCPYKRTTRSASRKESAEPAFATVEPVKAARRSPRSSKVTAKPEEPIVAAPSRPVKAAPVKVASLTVKPAQKVVKNPVGPRKVVAKKPEAKARSMTKALVPAKIAGQPRRPSQLGITTITISSARKGTPTVRRRTLVTSNATAEPDSDDDDDDDDDNAPMTKDERQLLDFVRNYGTDTTVSKPASRTDRGSTRPKPADVDEEIERPTLSNMAAAPRVFTFTFDATDESPEEVARLHRAGAMKLARSMAAHAAGRG